jgi:hypothetical protein
MQGINPRLWGKSSWIFLFYIVESYPDNPTNNNKNIIKNFFESLRYILPCEICRNNYKKDIKNIKLSNFYLKNKNNLRTWLYKIHDLTEKRINGKGMDKSNYIKKYSNNNSKFALNNINKKHIFNLICILVIILIIFLKFKQDRQ